MIHQDQRYKLASFSLTLIQQRSFVKSYAFQFLSDEESISSSQTGEYSIRNTGEKTKRGIVTVVVFRSNPERSIASTCRCFCALDFFSEMALGGGPENRLSPNCEVASDIFGFFAILVGSKLGWNQCALGDCLDFRIKRMVRNNRCSEAAQSGK